MDALILHVLAWPALAAALLVFGLAPGVALRLILLLYRKDHPRRRELLGELYAVPRIERPFWVAEQLEIAVFEGLRGRFATGRRNSAPGRGLGLAIVGVVVILAMLDALPLYLTALAFGLDVADTWLLTSLFVSVFAAGMLALDLTRRHTRLRGMLAAVLAVVCLGLIVLRTNFLTVVVGEAVPTAILGATLLISLPVALLFSGAVALTHIRLRLTRHQQRPPTRDRQ